MICLRFPGHYTTYALLDVPNGNAESCRSEKEVENDITHRRDAGSKKWMHFSDERAVQVTQEEVLGSEAYMLFYDKAT